ncbi:transposase, partial [Kitasatospora sp. NPDC093558]|uniref:IS701 family transposase n=1 Tax=Kitasatospora sp. NPDC093558 TaxID=3155201 RepID=UPI003432448B
MTSHHTAGTLDPGIHTSTSLFTEELFGHLPRADQRRWAHAYLQGLLTTRGKKSMRRLAATVSQSRTASQSLQQFINASPWEWDPARQELTRWIERRTDVRAWTIGCAVLPKRGDHSVGVHRRFVTSAGRVVNCQVGLGLFLATGRGEIPVDWHLLLRGPWCEDPELRQRARIPEETGKVPLWLQLGDMVASLGAHTSLAPAPLVADVSEYTDSAALARALDGREFVITVPGSLPVLPEGH